MRITYSFFFLSIFLCHASIGQGQLQEQRKKLSYYSDIVANAALTSTKSIANDKLVSAMEIFLESEGSFAVDLESDMWLSVKGPSDGAWRIITWELSSEDSSHYFGYIQMSDGEVIKLNDKASEMGDITYDNLDSEHWFGVLYYNLIEETDMDGNLYYILFGYNNLDKYTNRKVADVLTFVDGSPVFGKEIFYKKDKEGRGDILSRLYLEYSADSNVTLNYNPGMGMIVYDHLINRMGRMEGQGPTMLPDGSYSGYKAENGKWVYVDKLFDQISETVPRPKPILGNKKGRDIFGKKKN